jgi:hypothetical protein
MIRDVQSFDQLFFLFWLCLQIVGVLFVHILIVDGHSSKRLSEFSINYFSSFDCVYKLLEFCLYTF